MTGNRVAGVWLTLGEIAARDGVSRQAVSKHVGRLAASGLEVQRDGQGRVSLVNVADYDRLRARYGDPSKAQAPKPVDVVQPAPVAPQGADPAEPACPTSYEEAKRRSAWYEVEKRRLELEEARGDMVRRADVADAVKRFGQAIIDVVGRLPAAADDLAAAVASEGTHGARIALKKLAARQRDQMVAAIASALAAAPRPPQPALPDDDASPFETPPVPVTGADTTAEPRLF